MAGQRSHPPADGEQRVVVARAHDRHLRQRVAGGVRARRGIVRRRRLPADRVRLRRRRQQRVRRAVLPERLAVQHGGPRPGRQRDDQLRGRVRGRLVVLPVPARQRQRQT